jgi:hypothetical protein
VSVDVCVDEVLRGAGRSGLYSEMGLLLITSASPVTASLLGCGREWGQFLILKEWHAFRGHQIDLEKCAIGTNEISILECAIDYYGVCV